MHSRLFVALALLASLLPLAPTPAVAANCEYVLGFKVLHDLIPSVVGDCVVNEHHNVQNGDALQETSGVGGKGGLLVWRKADNWTAYTDGYRTWINGPNGLQNRLNTARFPWESAPAATPASSPAPAPTAAPAPAPAPTYAWRAEVAGWQSNCGAAWMWGNVYDRSGNLLNGMSVKSWNDYGNPYVIGSGSDSSRGTGQWVRLVNIKDDPQIWFVAIVDGQGNLASQPFTVRFDADCNSGAQVVQIDFHQN